MNTDSRTSWTNQSHACSQETDHTPISPLAIEAAIRMLANDGWNGSEDETFHEIQRLKGQRIPTWLYPPPTFLQRQYLEKHNSWTLELTRRGAWSLIHHLKQ